jgi:hypothetical protein
VREREGERDSYDDNVKTLDWSVVKCESELYTEGTNGIFVVLVCGAFTMTFMRARARFIIIN